MIRKKNKNKIILRCTSSYCLFSWWRIFKSLHWTSGSAQADIWTSPDQKEARQFIWFIYRVLFCLQTLCFLLVSLSCNTCVRGCFVNSEDQQTQECVNIFLGWANLELCFPLNDWDIALDFMVFDMICLLYAIFYRAFNCCYAAAEFFAVHHSPLLVCSLACVLSRQLGSSGVLLERTGSLLFLDAALPVPLLAADLVNGNLKGKGWSSNFASPK